MEEFFSIDHNDPEGRPVRHVGEFIGFKERFRTYKVGEDEIRGYKTIRQARASWTDKRARNIMRQAKRKVAGMTRREIEKCRPPGCTSYVDWCKWIVIYDGIPPDTIDCLAVDQYWKAYNKDHATLVQAVKKRKRERSMEHVSKKYRRILDVLFNVDESELDNVENALNVFTQST